MAYVKQNFETGQTLTADMLNHIEEGFDGVQETLISGTNIKTINGQSLLGGGNITIEGSTSSGGSVDSNVIKKAAFLGDSIIHGVYSYFNSDGNRENGFSTNDAETKRIPAYFSEFTGAEVLNLGKRGSGYVQDTRKLGNGLAVTRAQDFSDIDFVGICLGINDWIQGASLGTFSSPTSSASAVATVDYTDEVAVASTDTVEFANGFINNGQLIMNPNTTVTGDAAAVPIRLVNRPIYGAFTITVNSGYRIRNAIQFSQAVSFVPGQDTLNISPVGTTISTTSTTKTTLTVSDTNKYTFFTIAKADATQTISPDEDIVASITFPSSGGGDIGGDTGGDSGGGNSCNCVVDTNTIPNVIEGTVVGNMALMFQKILADNPFCKIVCYSPYNSWGQVSVGGDYASDVLYGSESTNYALGMTNKAGYTLQDLITAVDKVCNFYGITHVPLSKNNLCNRINIKNVMIDGLHPSRDARQKLAAEIYGKIYSK